MPPKKRDGKGHHFLEGCFGVIAIFALLSIGVAVMRVGRGSSRPYERTGSVITTTPKPSHSDSEEAIFQGLMKDIINAETAHPNTPKPQDHIGHTKNPTPVPSLPQIVVHSSDDNLDNDFTEKDVLGIEKQDPNPPTEQPKKKTSAVTVNQETRTPISPPPRDFDKELTQLTDSLIRVRESANKEKQVRLLKEQLQQLQRQAEDDRRWEHERELETEKDRQRSRDMWESRAADYRRWQKQRVTRQQTTKEYDERVIEERVDHSTNSDTSKCPGMNIPQIEHYVDFKKDIQVPQFAYVTFVTSADFVIPAAVLMHSIALSGSKYDRVIAVTSAVSDNDIELLSTFAQIVRVLQVIAPKFVDNPRYRDTFTKLRIWQLTQWKKLFYIDTDVLVIRNMDDVFDLNEWSVPMDAMQGRYSTGMMLVEPRLSTFQDMIVALSTTTVSMELPDLLFLQEFFNDRRSKINIIPRWYQVYQEEFGYAHKTYLTESLAPVTIFDTRIHGIHYPGAGKPFNNIPQLQQRWGHLLCDWAGKKELSYEPQFLWLWGHTLMRRDLKALRQNDFFTHERGRNVLDIEEAPVRPTPEPTEEPIPIFQSVVIPKSDVVDKSPPSSENFDWDSLIGLSPPEIAMKVKSWGLISSKDSQTTAAPQFKPNSCNIETEDGIIDLSTLEPISFETVTDAIDVELVGMQTVWVFTWCTPFVMTPPSYRDCSSPGVTSFFNSNTKSCSGNFHSKVELSELPDISGISLTAYGEYQNGAGVMKPAKLQAHLSCSLSPGYHEVWVNNSVTSYRTVIDDEPLQMFEVELLSPCFCPGVCMHNDTQVSKLDLPDFISEKRLRNDGRCGVNFPIPGTVQPTECDPTSRKNEVGPCCSGSGFCGSSSDHCNCQDCINYSKVYKEALGRKSKRDAILRKLYAKGELPEVEEDPFTRTIILYNTTIEYYDNSTIDKSMLIDAEAEDVSNSGSGSHSEAELVNLASDNNRKLHDNTNSDEYFPISRRLLDSHSSKKSDVVSNDNNLISKDATSTSKSINKEDEQSKKTLNSNKEEASQKSVQKKTSEENPLEKLKKSEENEEITKKTSKQSSDKIINNQKENEINKDAQEVEGSNKVHAKEKPLSSTIKEKQEQQDSKTTKNINNDKESASQEEIPEKTSKKYISKEDEPAVNKTAKKRLSESEVEEEDPKKTSKKQKVLDSGEIAELLEKKTSKKSLNEKENGDADIPKNTSKKNRSENEVDEVGKIPKKTSKKQKVLDSEEDELSEKKTSKKSLDVNENENEDADVPKKTSKKSRSKSEDDEEEKVPKKTSKKQKVLDSEEDELPEKKTSKKSLDENENEDADVSKKISKRDKKTDSENEIPNKKSSKKHSTENESEDDDRVYKKKSKQQLRDADEQEQEDEEEELQLRKRKSKKHRVSHSESDDDEQHPKKSKKKKLKKKKRSTEDDEDPQTSHVFKRKRKRRTDEDLEEEEEDEEEVFKKKRSKKQKRRRKPSFDDDEEESSEGGALDVIIIDDSSASDESASSDKSSSTYQVMSNSTCAANTHIIIETLLDCETAASLLTTKESIVHTTSPCNVLNPKGCYVNTKTNIFYWNPCGDPHSKAPRRSAVCQSAKDDDIFLCLLNRKWATPSEISSMSASERLDLVVYELERYSLLADLPTQDLPYHEPASLAELCYESSYSNYNESVFIDPSSYPSFYPISEHFPESRKSDSRSVAGLPELLSPPDLHRRKSYKKRRSKRKINAIEDAKEQSYLLEHSAKDLSDEYYAKIEEKKAIETEKLDNTQEGELVNQILENLQFINNDNVQKSYSKEQKVKEQTEKLESQVTIAYLHEAVEQAVSNSDYKTASKIQTIIRRKRKDHLDYLRKELHVALVEPDYHKSAELQDEMNLIKEYLKGTSEYSEKDVFAKIEPEERFAVGDRIKLRQKITFKSGKVLKIGLKGEAVSVPGATQGSPATVKVKGIVFDLRNGQAVVYKKAKVTEAPTPTPLTKAPMTRSPTAKYVTKKKVVRKPMPKPTPVPSVIDYFGDNTPQPSVAPTQAPEKTASKPKQTPNVTKKPKQCPGTLTRCMDNCPADSDQIVKCLKECVALCTPPDTCEYDGSLLNKRSLQVNTITTPITIFTPHNNTKTDISEHHAGIVAELIQNDLSSLRHIRVVEINAGSGLVSAVAASLKATVQTFEARGNFNAAAKCGLRGITKPSMTFFDSKKLSGTKCVSSKPQILEDYSPELTNNCVKGAVRVNVTTGDAVATKRIHILRTGVTETAADILKGFTETLQSPGVDFFIAPVTDVTLKKITSILKNARMGGQVEITTIPNTKTKTLLWRRRVTAKGKKIEKSKSKKAASRLKK